jgi:hypothetical protein
MFDIPRIKFFRTTQIFGQIGHFWMGTNYTSKRIGLAWAGAFIFLSLGCLGPVEHQITGSTMGTTYHIKVVAGYFENLTPVQKEVDELLAQINQSIE